MTENIKNNNLLLFLVNCIQTYNCDLACVVQCDSNVLIFDNYSGNINVKYPFACRYKTLKEILNIKISDDAITEYCKTNKLYMCCVNDIIEQSDISTNLQQDENYNPNIPNITVTKNIFRNVSNIYHNYEDGNYQIDIKYYDTNIFLGTLTYFGDIDKYNDSHSFIINSTKYIINMDYTYNKFSCFFEIVDSNILNIQENSFNNKIELFQIFENEINTFTNFYKQMTMLTYNNSYTYKNYTENDMDTYVKKEDSLVQKIYSYINSFSLKKMFFKLLKLYNDNSFYIDEECIQYNPIDLKKTLTCRSVENVYDYSDFIIYIYGEDNKKFLAGNIKILMAKIAERTDLNYSSMNNKKSINLEILQKYDLYINKNDDVYKIIDDNSITFFTYESNTSENTYNVDKDNNNLYKSVEYGTVFNGIDKIVWINLDKSEDRCDSMENMLKKINIPNERISAINCSNGNIDKYSNLEYCDNMTNAEKACTLSHFKAFDNLRRSKGKYFLVCEDDVRLSSILLYNVKISDIIKNMNEEGIEILTLHTLQNLDNLSLNSTIYSKKKKYAASSACYLITREGVDKLINVLEYTDKNGKFKKGEKYKKIFPADSYIYNFVNTYEYKYNLISTISFKSTISSDITKGKYILTRCNYFMYLNFIKTLMYFNEYFSEKNKFDDGTSKINEFIYLFMSFNKFNVYIKNKIAKHYILNKYDINKWSIEDLTIENNNIIDVKTYNFDHNIKINEFNINFVKKINNSSM